MRLPVPSRWRLLDWTGRQTGHAESGFALLLVLLLVALLAAVVVQFSLSSQVDWILASRRLEGLQQEQAIRAGVLEAKRLLWYDRDLDVQKGKMIDSLNEAWAQERSITVGPATVSIRIVDEGSLLNLSRLVDDQGQTVQAQADRLARLLDRIPEDGTSRASLAAALVDWIDKAPEGQAETGAFERRARQETFPLYTLKELLIVPGFTRKVVFGYDAPDGSRVPGLSDFTTARWGDGRANVNTAPYEVLLCLSSQMTPPRAAAIVTGRSGQPFENIQQVKDLFPDWTTFLDDVGPLLKVESASFRVDLVSSIGEGGETLPTKRTARAHLGRSADGVAVLSIEFF